MAITTRTRMMKLAVASAIAGTPLGFLCHLGPTHNPLAGATQTFGGKLADGRALFASRTDGDDHTVHVFVERDGNVAPLADGRYELDDGYGFAVAGGKLDYDSLIALPEGYTAWREIVVYPIYQYYVFPAYVYTQAERTPDRGQVVDYATYKAGGEIYCVMQRSGCEGYEMYKLDGDQVAALADGTYPLPNGDARISVAQGRVTPETVSHLLTALGNETV